MRVLRFRSRQSRRTRRRSGVGHGSYELPAVSDDRSGTCRVLDVSGSGVGLEVYGPWPRTVVGEELVLRLDPGADGTGGYELRGLVRNSARTKFGFARAGVEFPALSPDERTCLRSLAERRTVKR